MTHNIQTLIVTFPGKRELRVAAFDGNELMATASVSNWGKAAVSIFQLFVDAEWRKQGVGRAIVERIVEAAMEYGAEAIGAVVEVDGPTGFWQAMGFQLMAMEGGNSLFCKRIDTVKGEENG